MNSWGWRVPFLVAGPLGLVGMYLRSKMEDTPVFRELEQKTHETEEAAGTKLKEVVTGYCRSCSSSPAWSSRSTWSTTPC